MSNKPTFEELMNSLEKTNVKIVRGMYFGKHTLSETKSKDITEACVIGSYALNQLGECTYNNLFYDCIHKIDEMYRRGVAHGFDGTKRTCDYPEYYQGYEVGEKVWQEVQKRPHLKRRLQAQA